MESAFIKLRSFLRISKLGIYEKFKINDGLNLLEVAELWKASRWDWKKFIAENGMEGGRVVGENKIWCGGTDKTASENW